MKTLVTALMVVSLFFFASSAHAQQAPPAQPATHSMTGCLKAGTAAGTYMVTDVEGNAPKSIGIVSSAANLAPHVGHKMEVTGTAVPAADAEKDPKVPKAPHYMKLTAIKMISATCP
jgi:pyruvate/2-oxoglutarate dehydrogenase complex dihydrolipoamide acyltransferase (E2) component